MSETEFQRQVLDRLDRYEETQTVIHDALVGKINPANSSHVPGMLATLAKHHEALYGTENDKGIIHKVETQREFQVRTMAVVGFVVVLIGLITEIVKTMVTRH